MRNVCFRYTSCPNRRNNRTGHVFQGRHKALLIEADSYLLELVRYIHCNPVRARLVQSPDQYPWSSHRDYFNVGSFERRILGNGGFAEKSLARAEQKIKCRLNVEQIVLAVCTEYGIKPKMPAEPGKRQPAAIGRAVAASLVQDAKNLTLTGLSTDLRQDRAALSRAAERLRARAQLDSDLPTRIAAIRQQLEQISKCQA
jgi:hypothetical protein